MMAAGVYRFEPASHCRKKIHQDSNSQFPDELRFREIPTSPRELRIQTDAWDRHRDTVRSHKSWVSAATIEQIRP